MGTVKATGDVPEDIVREAMAEPALRGRVFLRSTRRVPLVHDGDVIGFVCPHETKSGWRCGPIYVRKSHRGHGHVKEWYAEHGDRAWVAFVADDNRASLSMHKRAGFVPWKKARGGQWMRREPTE